MVEQKQRSFQISINDVDKLFEDLAKYDIFPENIEDGFEFSIQYENYIYKIEINVMEKFTPDERAFMITRYPIIKTFADIQMRLFGKVEWK